MKTDGYFGGRVAQAGRATRSCLLMSHARKNAAMAVTYTALDDPGADTTPLPREDAFLFSLSVRGCFRRDLFLDDRSCPVSTPVPEGSFSFLDMRHHSRLRLRSPAETVQFYIPRASIDALSDAAGQPRIDELHVRSGAVVADDILHSLARALLPSFARPEQVSALFVDQMTLAAAIHVAGTYAGLKPGRQAERGGLAPWQARRAKEMLAADLTGKLPLARIAEACGLSAGHFSRAFKGSTGLAPHRWLVEQRVDKAMDLLRTNDRSLCEIALSCGFSDQSHFTRVFTQVAGVSPGAWRRQRSTGRLAEYPHRVSARPPAMIAAGLP